MTDFCFFLKILVVFCLKFKKLFYNFCLVLFGKECFA